MDIVKTYKKSFEITKKFKYLWIVGFAVAVSTASAGFNFNSFSSFSDFNNNENVNVSDSLKTVTNPESIDTLKGSVNSINEASGVKKEPKSFEEEKTFFLSVLKVIIYNLNGFFSVSMLWFLFAVFILSFVFGSFIKIVLKTWSLGALIGGIFNALFDKKVSLKEMSHYGKRNFKEMFLLLFLPKLILSTIAFVLVLPVVLIVILNFKNLSSPSIIVLLLFISMLDFFILFVLSILYKGIMAYAERLCIHQRLSWEDAFKSGFLMFKKNIMDTFLLAIVNKISKSLFFLVFIIIPLIIISVIVMGLSLAGEVFILLMVIVSVVLFLPFMFVWSFFLGALNTFEYTTWNILYLEKVKEMEVIDGR